MNSEAARRTPLLLRIRWRRSARPRRRRDPIRSRLPSGLLDDTSNYRRVPIGVVLPAHARAAANRRSPSAASTMCQCFPVAVAPAWPASAATPRSMIDSEQVLHPIGSLDAEAGIIVVEPGVNSMCSTIPGPTGSMVGPRPSTHVSCAIGGMIDNDSYGSTAQAYGKMVDTVRRVEVLAYDGLRIFGPTDDDSRPNPRRRSPARRDLPRAQGHRRRYADDIQSSYPKIHRRVSGYNLSSLLPANFGLAKAFGPERAGHRAARRGP